MTNTNNRNVMPYPFRHGDPSRGHSLTSFSFISPSYADRPSQQPSLTRNIPSKRSPRTAPGPVLEPRQEPQPSSVGYPTSVTPPPILSILLTPPGSHLRPSSVRPATGDEKACYPILAKVKSPDPVLHAFTPEILEALRASRESSFIFRKITPDNFSDWEAGFPELYEAKGVRYDYDGLSQRVIVKCMAGSVHDSFPIYFTRVVNRGLDRVGPECQRALQIFASTGESSTPVL